ncbi:FYVE and coiled-coil domain-containing protein 1 [Latimeria chalumnae]|uniref:FYVE and coiled-coil domain-containing protein 1 n=1 Tax=Latimeria chalumnae TaxID=7897 RepID=UPI0003C1763C|nr:PREDICTED: RUN and FYVE domain-containing protein 4 [Latimeria chalumnae]|eukprot:XP_006008387.1 PREDICTED: RUN and FYVE domain-containing protein 4 [Latimeria chalumnae]
MASDGEVYFQRVVKDLQSIILELQEEHREKSSPINDGSPALHRLCAKLEYLLQFDQKEKKSFFGNRRDYWDYICCCIGKKKGGNDGVHFVSSIPELKTSLGKGRAFIRCCLVQKQLAESLQLCTVDPNITSDWYYARSPLLNKELTSTIISHLYELNGINFKLALTGVDLDSAWPTFAGPPVHCNQNASSRKSDNPAQIKAPNTNGEYMESIGSYHEKPVAPEQNNGQYINHQNQFTIDIQKQEEAFKEYESKIASLEDQNKELINKMDSVLREMSQVRASHVSEDLNKVHELLDSLEASEKREIELQQQNVECQTQIGQFARELQDKEAMIQDLRSCIGKQEHAHLEKMTSLEQELEKTKEAHKQQTETIMQLEESNNILNETTEELDCLISDLKEKVSGKDQENVLLISNHQEEVTALNKAHAEEVEKLKSKLSDTVDQYEKQQNNIERQLTEALELLDVKEQALGEIKGKLQSAEMSRKNLEKVQEQLKKNCSMQEESKAKLTSENEELQIKFQHLDIQNKSLQEKLRKTEQMVEDLEVSSLSLQSEVSKLKVCEKELLEQTLNSSLTLDEKEQKLRTENQTLEEQLRDAQIQNETLNQKLKKSFLQKEDLEKEKDTLSESLATLEQSLKNAKLETQKLNKQLIFQQKEISDLKNSITLEEDNLKEKQHELKLLEQKLAKTASQLEETKLQKIDLEGKLADNTAHMEELTNSRAIVETQVTELKNKHEEAMKELRSKLSLCEKQLYQKELEVAKFEEEGLKLKAALQKASEEKGSKLKSVAVTLEEKAQEIAKLRNEAEELKKLNEEEIAKLKEKILATQGERDTLTQQKTELENKNFEMNKEYVQLKYQVKKLEMENSKAKEVLDKTKSESDQASIQLSCLSVEKEGLGKKLAGTEAELSQQKEKTSKAEQELQSTLDRLQQDQLSLQEVTAAMEDLKRVNQELLVRLQTTEGQLTALDTVKKQEIIKLKEEFAEEVEDHEAKIKVLNEDLLKVKQENQLKEESLTDKENEMKSHMEELEKAKRDYEGLKEKLEKTQAEARDKERKYKTEIEDQKHMIRTMKDRVLELLKEKDALWQKSEQLRFEQRQNPNFYAMDKK